MDHERVPGVGTLGVVAADGTGPCLLRIHMKTNWIMYE